MNNFILESSIEDLTICDKLIEYHKNSLNKAEGKVFFDGDQVVDPEYKLSTDVILSDTDSFQKYSGELYKCVEKYLIKYPFSGHYGSWRINETVLIQHYKPNGGFFAWHTERNSNKSPVTFRHLVFMTYLNDVNDGGETEFFHQNVKYVPKKGTTLIWPADWTHTHRGITSLTEEKYIITGWFSYF